MTVFGALRAFRDATEPTPEQVARVQRRLGLGDAEAISRRLLSSASVVPTATSRAAESRVRSRLLGQAPTPSRVPLVAVALAAAAVALLSVWARPAPDAPVALQLEPKREPIAVGDKVQLVSAGVGSAGGTEHQPHVRWESGRLDVSVVPHSQVQLSVETAEATVKVVGTVFSVERDVMGTRVEVSHGLVEVTCTGQASTRITPGISTTCLPATAAGRFGRARAMSVHGSPVSGVLAALDAADALGPTPPLSGEILAFRFELLRSSGDAAAALEVAERYRAEGYQERAGSVAAAAAVLALELRGCEAAMQWMDDADAATATAVRLRCHPGNDAPAPD